jgi:hypothetical protein
MTRELTAGKEERHAVVRRIGEGKAMKKHLGTFDLARFWVRSEYARREYVGRKLTPEMVQTTETKIGYKLPGSCVALLESQNGGFPR